MLKQDGSGKATEGPGALGGLRGRKITRHGARATDRDGGRADDALMERFFEAGTLTQEELLDGLRKAVLSRQGGAASLRVRPGRTWALRAAGRAGRLRAVAGRPAVYGDRHEGEQEVNRTADRRRSVPAFVWKTMADPFAGRITLFRVMTGTLKSDTSVHNLTATPASASGTSP